MPHCDNDRSYYTFGVWALVDKNDNWLNIIEQPLPSDVEVTKVGFYIAPYQLRIEFHNHPKAIRELIWRGNMDIHGTIRGTGT